MFRNDWVDSEVRSLKSEIHCNKPRTDNMHIKMFIMLIVLLFLTVNAFGEVCPCCYQELPSYNEATTQLFPDTWRCTNPKCRYENYEGIDYCALCGRKRR